MKTGEHEELKIAVVDLMSVYIVSENGADNLWLQPLNGLHGRPIANFTSDSIQNCEFSPDGKSIGVLTSHIESDLVLLRDHGTSGR